ncbi:MAG TPA: phage holin family protein [Ornithinimicrobium sp.]|uniref:phage holin family protein n=1 Tax=Ornithinimicrobium sp. TaxID=1977084 RepID=UPI002B49BFDD|nr:phage holin family protein [Ornithinimicrobium sp.]HKJ12366.1 phage holin family protein [Ornithinimicrobium sp.]
MSTSEQPHTNDERSVGQLVADLSADVSSIFRSEVELAKVEIKHDVTHAGKGAGMFAGAAVFGAYGFGLLLLGLAWVIAIWLPVWAGLLIVSGVLFVIAAILGLMGKGQVSRVKGKPQKTIDNAQATVAAVKQS